MNRKALSNSNRRDFLKTTGVLAAGTVLASQWAPRVHAAESNTIKAVLVGCGNRGGGAIRQALNADPNIVLWAVADTFADKANGMADAVKSDLESNNQGKKFDVAADRRFVGFDAYKKAMDSLSPGDVVVLATPPAFRPLHFAYAVEKGLNVFAEKPVAVDIPGLKWLQETNKKAKEKGLKVAVGLNNRHYFRTEETIKAIHDGKIGDVVSTFVYRLQSPHRVSPIGDRTPLEQQLRNIFCFNWTTGGFIVDALIHNLDICCWAMGQGNDAKIPVACQGYGGRIVRTDKDELMDISLCEFTFDDGRKMTMHMKCIPNTWNCFQGIVHGTKGSAVVGETVNDPKMFSDYNAFKDRRRGAIWTPTSPGNDSYQTEHDRFFKAIRDDQPWNEMDRGINATFVPILGRMAVDTGQEVTADMAWSSPFKYVEDIANMSFDKPAPVLPDENGNYAMPYPGKTIYW
ncbi:MAG: Gfo/Idh/MocA family oxidoreductase [Planctomycetaceae bacterium]|nr:Gfo/Idh/MocA family oxidoreductase [Planctomycetaceae bacterium]